jgi:hypothetical protein
VQGAAATGARVSRDLLGIQADPADQQPGVSRPPVRAVVGDGDLRVRHVDRLHPVGLVDAGQHPPQRSDAFGADRELHTLAQRGAGHLSGEVPGIQTYPYPPGPC